MLVCHEKEQEIFLEAEGTPFVRREEERSERGFNKTREKEKANVPH